METSTDQSEGTPGFESENFLRTEGSLRNHFTTLISDATAPIFRLVLTGGPCAGKTTAMTIIEERMRTRGFRTFIVPEAASLLISGGFMFGGSVSREMSFLSRQQLKKVRIHVTLAYNRYQHR